MHAFIASACITFVSSIQSALACLCHTFCPISSTLHPSGVACISAWPRRQHRFLQTIPYSPAYAACSQLIPANVSPVPACKILLPTLCCCSVVDFAKQMCVNVAARELHVCASFSRNFFWCVGCNKKYWQLSVCHPFRDCVSCRSQHARISLPRPALLISTQLGANAGLISICGQKILGLAVLCCSAGVTTS